MVNLYYWNGRVNAGDYYSYWLAKKLYKEVTFSTSPNLIIAGSILGDKHINNNTMVWGAGWHNSKWANKCLITKKDNFKAVRGKLTAEFLGISNVALGDPGLLASKFYQPKFNIKTNKVLILSHWQDYKKLYDKFHTKYKVINMATNDLESLFEEICKSELVISSSLHGIIFAHSFVVPAIHIEETDIGSKDNFKFKDYYSVLDIDYVKYKSDDILNFKIMSEIWSEKQKYKPSLSCVQNIQNNLLKALPKEETLKSSLVGLCAIAKCENNYIREWVKHYKNLSFDKIFLFDNNDVDGEHFEDVIKDYIDSGFVEVINVRGKTNQQIECYDKLYHSSKLNNFSWIAYFDIDEFLHINNTDIHSYLSDKKFDNFDGIAINWKYYDDNNLLGVENNNYSINRFTHEYQEKDWEWAQHRFTKRILRTNLDLVINSSHGPLNKAQMKEYKQQKNNKIIICNTDGQRINNTIAIFNWTHKTAYLAHYRFKTISEYIDLKMKRGYPTLYKNSGKDMNLLDFFKLNNLTQEKLDFLVKTYNIQDKTLQERVENYKKSEKAEINKSILKEQQKKNKEVNSFYLYF